MAVIGKFVKTRRGFYSGTLPKLFAKTRFRIVPCGYKRAPGDYDFWVTVQSSIVGEAWSRFSPKTKQRYLEVLLNAIYPLEP